MSAESFLPNGARYQAEPHPDIVINEVRRSSGREGVIRARLFRAEAQKIRTFTTVYPEGGFWGENF